ncbi:hypothetical protein BH11CYA1_BH11CYA1_48480 [soil metagenome]
MQRRQRKGLPSLLQYQQLKAAAGGAGSGGGGHLSLRHLRANKEITVHIVEAIPGGYLIQVPDFNMPSYLISEANIAIGHKILAQFLCLYKNNLIFCPLAG